jgi:hypothetical protein
VDLHPALMPVPDRTYRVVVEVTTQFAAVEALSPDHPLKRLEGGRFTVLVHPPQERCNDLLRIQFCIAFGATNLIENTGNRRLMRTDVGREVMSRKREQLLLDERKAADRSLDIENYRTSVNRSDHAA